VPWADPSKGQIVVKVLACGVCASDLAAQYGLLGASHPRVPGHEVVGEVVAVGPGETTWKTGDRVGAGWHGGHCHDCKHCRSGTFVFCEKQDINVSNSFADRRQRVLNFSCQGILRDGAYAEYCTLRTEACISIPRDADPAEMAPILCAGVTCYAPMRDMKIQPGDIAAVHGVGYVLVFHRSLQSLTASPAGLGILLSSSPTRWASVPLHSRHQTPNAICR
jgi:D-arabinose 1-dehydrogenase-like Zn-dependent alcohol dehydrogenase